MKCIVFLMMMLAACMFSGCDISEDDGRTGCAYTGFEAGSAECIEAFSSSQCLRCGCALQSPACLYWHKKVSDGQTGKYIGSPAWVADELVSK